MYLTADTAKTLVAAAVAAVEDNSSLNVEDEFARLLDESEEGMREVGRKAATDAISAFADVVCQDRPWSGLADIGADGDLPKYLTRALARLEQEA